MSRLYLVLSVALLSVFFCCGGLAKSQDKTATVNLQIVNIYTGDDLGVPTVKTFEGEYGDVPSGNFAERFRGNRASNIPYDLYRLCAGTAGFWTACTEVPVYQHEVWVVLGLRLGMPGLAGLSNKLSGTVKNVPSGESPIWMRLMGLYSGIAIDAKADASGHFLMSGIPPGKWVLVTIQGDSILDTMPVQIPTTGPVEVDLQPPK